MSLFGKILEKLGLRKPEEAAPAPTAAPKPVAKAVKPAARPVAAAPSAIRPDPGAPAAAPVAPMAMVDVMSKLEKMAAGTGLDWKVSIVDLLKVLGIDSSLQARKELAQELGCPDETMRDNVAMNVWLHKTVLKKIADNGGNIPKELLD
ncbi:MAG: DUF3597 domain-containing protein [Anaerolineales bacterium]